MELEHKILTSHIITTPLLSSHSSISIERVCLRSSLPEIFVISFFLFVCVVVC